MSKLIIKDRCGKCGSIFERMITPIEKMLGIQRINNLPCNNCYFEELEAQPKH